MEFGALVDVALGILAVVILFSLGASAINEFVADNIMRLRGRTLAKGIEQLLAKRTGLEGRSLKALVGDFYRDPAIRALMEGNRRPSAIEPRRYALTALKLLNEWDTAKEGATARLDTVKRELAEVVRETAGNLDAADAGAEVTRRLEKTLDKVAAGGRAAAEEVEQAIGTLEREFNEAMDRVSGWYLRRTKINLFVIGLVLAVGANVDLLHYADRMMTQEALSERVDAARALFDDDELQSAFLRYAGAPATADGGKLAATEAGGGVVDASVDGAASPAAAPDDPFGAESLNHEIGLIAGALGDLDVQIGWRCAPSASDGPVLPLTRGLCLDEGTGLPLPTFSRIIGWLIIAFAVTLGAQFWFDLFKRLAHLRTSGVTGAVAQGQASSPSG